MGIVKITKIEKNSKSQDMKIYSATKFSIVIVPPKLSEKTKESKLLVRSFRHIYKVAGLGIATGLSGLLSLSQLQQDKEILIPETMSNREFASIEESSQKLDSSNFGADESAESISASAPMRSAPESEMDADVVLSGDIRDESLEISDIGMSSGEIITTTSELFLPLVIATMILGGLTVFYLYKYFKKS